MQISRAELDLPIHEPDYAQFSGYPPTIYLTISHVAPSGHDQMETDLKLTVSGLKGEVEFCLPLPNACAVPSAYHSLASKCYKSFVYIAMVGNL